MGERGNPALNQTMLERFVNLMGLFPVGNLVRLSTDELAVVAVNDMGVWRSRCGAGLQGV
jgi:hypothetical protein